MLGRSDYSYGVFWPTFWMIALLLYGQSPLILPNEVFGVIKPPSKTYVFCTWLSALKHLSTFLLRGHKMLARLSGRAAAIQHFLRQV